MAIHSVAQTVSLVDPFSCFWFTSLGIDCFESAAVVCFSRFLSSFSCAVLSAYWISWWLVEYSSLKCSRCIWITCAVKQNPLVWMIQFSAWVNRMLSCGHIVINSVLFMHQRLWIFARFALVVRRHNYCWIYVVVHPSVIVWMSVFWSVFGSREVWSEWLK